MTTATATGEALEIRRLGEALGAEALGLDLARPLAPEVIERVREAFLEHHLLCLRSAPLEAADFARVARHFGEPQLQLTRRIRHREVPEVSVLVSTYERAEDKPEDLQRVRLAGWHTDDSYFATPAKATVLQSLALPDRGGETRFANTRMAYEELPSDVAERIAGLQAVHCYDTRRAGARPPARTSEEANETPDVVHPLVRTHEDTGRRAIYFNPNRTDAVLGMDRAESDELLDFLHTHVTQARFQYHHQWRLGDVLLWDNRCLLHSVNVDYPVGQARVHQRILLRGPRPV